MAHIVCDEGNPSGLDDFKTLWGEVPLICGSGKGFAYLYICKQTVLVFTSERGIAFQKMYYRKEIFETEKMGFDKFPSRMLFSLSVRSSGTVEMNCLDKACQGSLFNTIPNIFFLLSYIGHSKRAYEVMGDINLRVRNLL